VGVGRADRKEEFSVDLSAVKNMSYKPNADEGRAGVIHRDGIME
jgi:hypothetical protein